MANGRGGRKKATGRDAGGFIALPWSVLDSAAYQALSHPAKALLMEIARQFVRDNNGKLLCSMNYLKPRGWRSQDVVTRAKRELLDAGLIFETCKGGRPNHASWYAVTWYTLDKHAGYDPEADNFRRGAYRDGNYSLTPSHGASNSTAAPSHGAIEPYFNNPSAPSGGDHLEKPSTAAKHTRKPT